MNRTFSSWLGIIPYPVTYTKLSPCTPSSIASSRFVMDEQEVLRTSRRHLSLTCVTFLLLSLLVAYPGSVRWRTDSYNVQDTSSLHQKAPFSDGRLRVRKRSQNKNPPLIANANSVSKRTSPYILGMS
jgi:hypothetical protein